MNFEPASGVGQKLAMHPICDFSEIPCFSLFCLVVGHLPEIIYFKNLFHDHNLLNKTVLVHGLETEHSFSVVKQQQKPVTA